MNPLELIMAADPNHRKLSEITKIYSGKENACRCGCAGKYFYKNLHKAGFTRSINTMSKPDFKPLKKGDIMYSSYGNAVSRGVEYGPNYIDIPYNADSDKCYCLYFD